MYVGGRARAFRLVQIDVDVLFEDLIIGVLIEHHQPGGTRCGLARHHYRPSRLFHRLKLCGRSRGTERLCYRTRPGVAGQLSGGGLAKIAKALAALAQCRQEVRHHQDDDHHDDERTE